MTIMHYIIYDIFCIKYSVPQLNKYKLGKQNRPHTIYNCQSWLYLGIHKYKIITSFTIKESCEVTGVSLTGVSLYKSPIKKVIY